MTFESYIELRSTNFPVDIEAFRFQTREFMNRNQNEEGQARVREVVERIEMNIIRNIYNGLIFQL
jgi:hypothetical protein